MPHEMFAAPHYPIEPLAVAGAVVGLCMAGLWLLSLRLRNVSIVDGFWGPAFVVFGWSLAFAHDQFSPRGLLVLGLLSLWGLRLGWHLTRRAWGEPEDRRYAAMRARRGPAFAWQSLYVVFGLQTLLLFIIAAPVQLAVLAEPTPLGALDVVGAVLWLIGFGFEVAADHQLTRFRADPANRGRVLDTGVFRYSRHPNYFGDACAFWGLGVVALGVPGGAWALLGPLLLTTMLLKVSGVAMLEADIGERRPGYARYVRRTSAFIPWFPARSER